MRETSQEREDGYKEDTKWGGGGESKETQTTVIHQILLWMKTCNASKYSLSICMAKYLHTYTGFSSSFLPFAASSNTLLTDPSINVHRA